VIREAKCHLVFRSTFTSVIIYYIFDRSPRDEYLVAYEKHHRRGLHVWEVQCSSHRNRTIQGLVRYLFLKIQLSICTVYLVSVFM